jgi:hypothetical protein
MVCILKNESDRLVSSEATNTKIQPIFGIVVHTNIGVSLDLDGERCGGCYCSAGHVTAREAAIDDDVVVESEVVAIGVPLWLLLFVLRRFAHLNQ